MMPSLFHENVVHMFLISLSNVMKTAGRRSAMICGCQQIENINIKENVLMVNTPESLSSHIQASTTFIAYRAMKESFIGNRLQTIFSGYIRTH